VRLDSGKITAGSLVRVLRSVAIADGEDQHSSVDENTGTFSQTYGSIAAVILHMNDVPCCSLRARNSWPWESRDDPPPRECILL
jgi:hypothetical protein